MGSFISAQRRPRPPTLTHRSHDENAVIPGPSGPMKVEHCVLADLCTTIPKGIVPMVTLPQSLIVAHHQWRTAPTAVLSALWEHLPALKDLPALRLWHYARLFRLVQHKHLHYESCPAFMDRLNSALLFPQGGPTVSTSQPPLPPSTPPQQTDGPASSAAAAATVTAAAALAATPVGGAAGAGASGGASALQQSARPPSSAGSRSAPPTDAGAGASRWVVAPTISCLRFLNLTAS